MRKLLLLLGLSIFWIAPAHAQVPCVGVTGVNSFPTPGIGCSQEPLVSSYGATSLGLVPVAAGPTDMLCISGKAGVVIRVQRIRVNGSGTAISFPVLIVKRASLDTGAFSATSTQIPVPYAMDSSNATASATIGAWITSNPTIVDTSPGYLDSAELGIVATTVGVVSDNVDFDYRGQRYMEAPTLRKATEAICVNGNATALTALLNISVQWTEAVQ